MQLSLFCLVSLMAMAMTLFTATVQVEARPNVDRTPCLGIAWATDDRWAHQLANNPRTCVYHHWENGHVASLSRQGIKFVPMYWGPTKADKWARMRKLFPRYRYSHVLFLNEPDVPSQSNVSPGRAASLFMSQMKPLRDRYGTKISSPNICYDTNWLKSFTKILHSKHTDYDFVAAHYYGPVSDLGRFKKYINKLHSMFPGKPIWITEYGLTQASNPSAQSALDFMARMTDFMMSTRFVHTMMAFGAFAINNPPDQFGAAQNAMFTGNGGLRKIGRYFAYNARKRDLEESEAPKDIRRRHHAMLLRMREADEDANDKDDPIIKVENPTDCDESNPRDNCKFLKTISEDSSKEAAFDPAEPFNEAELKDLKEFEELMAKRDAEEEIDWDAEEAEAGGELLSELDL